MSNHIPKKTLIIYMSIHHGNTEKVAKKIAKVLGADLKKPYEVNSDDLDKYDLIGFGSGAYFHKPHTAITDFLNKLPDMRGKKAFIFMTYGIFIFSGFGIFKKAVKTKGFNLAGEYCCRGFDTWGPFKFIGGIAKGRPNERDFKKAEQFALGLKQLN